jgi:ABC-type transport system involved in multi-copper enzyme maturation permease subunit
MNPAGELKIGVETVTTLPWALWLRQIAAILRLEVRKNFFGRRAFLIYLLAGAPVLLMAALTLLEPDAEEGIRRNWGQAAIIFANLYEGLILRTVVFFGCAWIFMNLFRGEVVDKSLHYYFLAPLRREVLVAGKYLSGLVTSSVLFTGTTAGTLFFLYLARGYPANVEYLFHGPGLRQVLTYLGITLLACLGYGAFFLIIGLFFRNPIIPGLVIYGWEWINFLLPPVLKRISVVHYLHSLAPVPVPEGPFALVAEPTPAWISVPGLLIVTALVLLFAGLRIRHMEISYGGE